MIATELYCRYCHTYKAPSEFYDSSIHANGKHNQCIDCARQRPQRTVPREIAGRVPEDLAIQELARHGIFATPGKSSPFRWVDVVAWGCVRLEVKLATLRVNTGNNYPSYAFKFSPKQVKERLLADLVVLICESEQRTFHVFEPQMPFFFTLSGERKTGVSYIPNRKTSVPNALTDQLMNEAKDRWELIETVRQCVIMSLSND